MQTINDLTLALASYPDDWLDVRRVSVREGMNELFEIRVVAVSQDDAIDLDAIVGQGFALTLHARTLDGRGQRAWAGVCAQMTQLETALAPGVSTYELVLVPALWRATLRTNCRIHQHETTPEIVTRVLAEWDIAPVMRLRHAHLKHEYIVQYNETDFAFVSRLLEEAGISYYFENAAIAGKGEAITKLVLDDAPHTSARSEGVLTYAGSRALTVGPHELFCAGVSMTRRLTKGRITFRGHDFRRRPDMPLHAEQKMGTEENYEHYEYRGPGFSRWSGEGDGETPTADARGAARTDHVEGARIAERSGHGERRRRVVVSFRTNAPDVGPGKVIAVNQNGLANADHPRPDLAPDKALLVISSSLEAEPGRVSVTVDAVLTASPYHPDRKTPKPRIHGLQSATVTGPPGEEIHVDEWGRVCVQFPWDRAGSYDHLSSCWIRVNQGWAGGNFGLAIHPRVGWEALVAYYEGDPDLPVIVGFVHNATTKVPHALPANKDSSRWRSNSYPGGAGYNEIHFKDTNGDEEFNLQAQKDHGRVVNNDMRSHVGNDKTSHVGNNDAHHVGLDSLLNAGGSILSSAATLHRMLVGPETGLVMRKDKVIVLSTGGASIKLSGDDIDINASGNICFHAGREVHLSSNKGAIRIQGGQHVLINEQDHGPPVKPDRALASDAPIPPSAGAPGTAPFQPDGRPAAITQGGPFPGVDVGGLLSAGQKIAGLASSVKGLVEGRRQARDADERATHPPRTLASDGESR